MREIKFRAWDGKCYTTDFFITSEGTVFKPHYDRDAEIVSDFTIEQFTVIKLKLNSTRIVVT